MTITGNLELGKREIENFEKLEKTIYRTVLQFGREITAKTLESMDAQLLGSRDVRWFRCKGFQKTRIKTIMGPVEFERRVYVDDGDRQIDQRLRKLRIGNLLLLFAQSNITWRSISETTI